MPKKKRRVFIRNFNLEIYDDGCGVRLDEVERILKPFYDHVKVESNEPYYEGEFE